jgi:hypothetical protein
VDGVSPEALPDPIRLALSEDDEVLKARWERLAEFVKERFGKDAGLESILFLIGVQSRGRGYQPKLKKELKQDLIMEGTCCAFETIGLYTRVGADSDGNWIWGLTVPNVPKLPLEQQEKVLRVAVLRYFEPYIDDVSS